MAFRENDYEETIVELLEDLDYEHLYGPDVDRGGDYHNPLYVDQLRDSLSDINPNASYEVIDEAIRILSDISSGSIEERNFIFMDYLQNGMPVKFLDGDEERTEFIRLVDYNDLENNTFQVINQWTVVEFENKRPDIIIFVNGLPLVVMELKSPSREDAGIKDAYMQIRNYIKWVPSLFVYNAFCVISDLASSKAGTITSDFDRFMEWKTVNGDYTDTAYASYDVLFEGMFERNRFLDIIHNFILFSNDANSYSKILCAYHQYFAVNKALSTTSEAVSGDGKAGVFWHTQGSGKSLSMVFYVKKLQSLLESPTFVVITDRNDLDDQLYGQFNQCSDFLGQSPRQATSRKNLKDLLNNRFANGIFFTTMQKFEATNDPLTEREDVIVISDEAHRGHYGFDEKVNVETGEITVGAARHIRDNLPKATFIGFTGTPISSKDRSTREVFGDYIDVYDMTQSVEDGATCEIHYESRVINLELDEETLNQIDRRYDELAVEAEPNAIEQSKKQMSQMEVLLGAPETINSLTDDLINHYTDFRMHEVEGKAMIVAYSRNIAMKIYERILETKPEWKDKVKIVMTSNNKDPEAWSEIIGNKSYKKQLAGKFKDPQDEFKIAIVVDMWLTGFDVPSLDTMYIFKPMKDHTLMQAIARVNRVYDGKTGGLIVDYIGIGSALRKAMSDYTGRDKKNYGNMDVDKVIYPKFQEILEICRDQFHPFEYDEFFNGTNKQRADVIKEGINFIMSKNEDARKSFLDEGLRLKQSLSLCRSRATEKERLEAAYIEAVRSTVNKITRPGKLSLTEINEQISKLLEHSIKSKGVINLFDTSEEDVNLFDEKFLTRISGMEQKNLAIETLRKLLDDEIKGSTYKLNVVKSEKFSEMLQSIMNKYINGHISNQEVIDELVELAHAIKEDKSSGKELGLTQEELAFYDAITKPENIKDFYQNEELIAMTRELTDKLNKNRTIDWQKKESARAGMRMIVKRLLKKHNYPPDGLDYAIEIVMEQCEQWADIQI